MPIYNTPAFPSQSNAGIWMGLTIRDYFAIHCRSDLDIQFAGLISVRWAANMCYDRADAMLLERSKKDASKN